MNDFLSLAQKRYAVRSYLPKPVEAEKLERILEAGRVAPTAKNTQPFRFLVVQHPERLKKLSACTNVKGYPLAIIVCSVASEVWVRPFDGKSKPDTDAAIAATHMLLEATDLGLGSCWPGSFLIPRPYASNSASPKGQSLNTSSPSVTRRKIRTPPSGTPSASRWRILLLRNLSRKDWREALSPERGLSSKTSPKDFCLEQ